MYSGKQIYFGQRCLEYGVLELVCVLVCLGRKWGLCWLSLAMVPFLRLGGGERGREMVWARERYRELPRRGLDITYAGRHPSTVGIVLSDVYFLRL